MINAAESRAVLVRFTSGELTAVDARRALGDATYGDLLRMVAQEGLNLPRVTSTGREDQLARAREWMFPPHAA